MDGFGLLLRILKITEAEPFGKISDQTLNVRAIVSMDVYIPKGTKVITHRDKVPVSVKEQRNTIGRAVVGGALMGPLGAVVGGVSGLGGKTNVEYHASYRTETIETSGKSQLVLGTNDINNPVIRIEFIPSNISNEWYYRIRAAQSRF